MILQALVEYYEALERKEKITSPGWCRARVAYGLDISEQGELMGVIPLKKEQQKGKKTVWVPQDLTVPQMVSRCSGVSANFLCDHSGYMLGIDNKGKPERSRECFEYAKRSIRTFWGISAVPQPGRCAAFLTAGRRTGQQKTHTWCRNWRRSYLVLIWCS